MNKAKVGAARAVDYCGASITIGVVDAMVCYNVRHGVMWFHRLLHTGDDWRIDKSVEATARGLLRPFDEVRLWDER